MLTYFVQLLCSPRDTLSKLVDLPDTSCLTDFLIYFGHCQPVEESDFRKEYSMIEQLQIIRKCD